MDIRDMRQVTHKKPQWIEVGKPFWKTLSKSSHRVFTTGGFHSHGGTPIIPIAGWFRMENP
jgi:hypothetical protein